MRKAKSKIVKKTPQQLYVAVVITKTKNTKELTHSKNLQGDWACFVDVSQDAAVTRANHAIEKWGRNYTIFIGKLDAEAVVWASYAVGNIELEWYEPQTYDDHEHD